MQSCIHHLLLEENYFWLIKLKVFPCFFFICWQAYQHGSSYHPSWARASWHSMLSQGYAPHPRSYASSQVHALYVLLCHSEIFLKPQPADLWSLCFLHYFISDIKSLSCLILECNVLIIPGVQPPFLYPPSCSSYPLQIKPQSAKLSWNSFKIYIIKMWNGCL